MDDTWNSRLGPALGCDPESVDLGPLQVGSYQGEALYKFYVYIYHIYMYV